jgi:hypothetical protein
LLDVAWLNQTKLVDSPLLLLRLTHANVGETICPPAAARVEYDRGDRWPQPLWPSPVRHWPAELPPLPFLTSTGDEGFAKPVASLHVLVTANAPHNDIIAAVESDVRVLGAYVVWVKHRRTFAPFGLRKATTTFSLAVAAFHAVRNASNGSLRTTSGAVISATFV